MAIIKKNLNSILGAFTKVQADLDVFIAEQAQRKQIALNNLEKLSDLRCPQVNICSDADAQATKAASVQAKIAALIE